MKRFVCLICVISWVVSTHAQSPSLFITTDKTTSLIFPFPIKHVDRGTKEVLVEQVKEANNILLIKAAANSFPETNLSVITSDGSLYSFAVRYEAKPANWVYRLPIQSKVPPSTCAHSLLDNPRTVHGISDQKWGIYSSVSGIYINDGIIYYQIELYNQSSIDYDISFLRFYIRDKKRIKRTAVQEIELTPCFIAGNTTQVKANAHNTLVVALDKFTLPDQKYLAIEIGEKNGGRNLLMKVNNKKIIKAIILPNRK